MFLVKREECWIIQTYPTFNASFMENLIPIFTFAAGLLCGIAVMAFFLLSQLRKQQGLEAERQRLELALREAEIRLDAQQTASNEKLAVLEEARNRLSDAFKALSAEALQKNNEAFLQLAKENLSRFQTSAREDLDQRQESIGKLVKPLSESLEKMDREIRQLESKRTEAYAGLSEHLKSLMTTQERLQGETSNLVKALRAPQVRGRWGELQLRRTVELAGMLNYCDFEEQSSVQTEEGRQRPDMIVRLPNGRNIVVDAKAPLAAYLESLEAPTPEEQKRHLETHARQIRDHLKALGTKNYWKQFEPSPEFVVLFLPGETFFSAALEQDPSLIDYGIENRVVLATPTTLIALLRAVAYGWRQEEIAKEAKTISQLGAELYDRLSTLAGHFQQMRRGLENATQAYNKAVSSMESRVLPSARKFKELHASTEKDIPQLEPATSDIRQTTAEEITPPDPS